MLNKMIKKTLLIVLSVVVTFVVTGCSTPKEKDKNSVVVDAIASATETLDTEENNTEIVVETTTQKTEKYNDSVTRSYHEKATSPIEINTKSKPQNTTSKKQKNKNAPTKSKSSKVKSKKSKSTTTKPAKAKSTKPVKAKSTKPVKAKSITDKRDKVTMIDLNKSYIDNAIYYENIPTIKQYIAKSSIAIVKMPKEYKELETALVNALDSADTDFTYTITNSDETFFDAFIINHMTYGNCKATLYYGCVKQFDDTYILSVDLASTRESIAKAKTDWNNKVANQKKIINKKNTANAKFKQQNNAYKNKIYKCVVASGVKKGMPVEEAINKIHDYICKINQYDYTYTHYDYYDIFDYGTSVCSGYANLFFLMAQRCGIDVEMVSSKSMNHIWNVVHFDGKTLYVDVTWSDTGSRRYCLLSKSKMSKTHTFTDIVIDSEYHIVYN